MDFYSSWAQNWMKELGMECLTNKGGFVCKTGTAMGGSRGHSFTMSLRKEAVAEKAIISSLFWMFAEMATPQSAVCELHHSS